MASFSEPRTAGFPDRVGRYELLLPIGTGGMATVFLARAQGVGGFQRDVALKLIHAHLRADEESKLHLLEEARLAARIRHPNVVPVLEVDEDPFGVFLVMDYVEGETLSGLMRAAQASKTEIPRPLIARILSDALSGLEAAHELKDERGEPLGLVHRDFSPQNILVSVDGVARLSDFGIAKATSRAVRTKTGLVKGKIAYMAPEQARGRDIDRRCDVWAAGVVAWELIAGQPMYSQNDDEVATLLRIVTEEPPRLRSVKPDVPVELERVVSEALTVNPSQRCPSAEAFRKRLAAAWKQDGGIADPLELGVFVKQLVGDRLSERNNSIEEVRTLRARMVELARPAVDDAHTVETPASDPEPVTLHREPAALAPPDVDIAGELGGERPLHTEKVARHQTPLPPPAAVGHAAREPEYEADFAASTPTSFKSASNRRSLFIAGGLALGAAAIASFVAVTDSEREPASAGAGIEPPTDESETHVATRPEPPQAEPESNSAEADKHGAHSDIDRPVLPSELEPFDDNASDAEPELDEPAATTTTKRSPSRKPTHRTKSAPGSANEATSEKNRVLPPSVPPLARDPY